MSNRIPLLTKRYQEAIAWLVDHQVNLLTASGRSSPVKASGSSQGHPNADLPGEMSLLGQHIPQRPMLTVLHDDGEAGAPICKAQP